MVGADVLGGPARPVRALRPVNTERAEARGHGDGFGAGRARGTRAPTNVWARVGGAVRTPRAGPSV